ncbi:MAG TPA: PAS domain S-box protein, partial [Halobacteriales archaeon]|nr:PAS domain S-box protein [Halobacteriales archaeon]
MSSTRMAVERLEAICNASPDGILIVDSDGRITFANDRVSDLFGYDPDELRGEPVEVLVPEEYRETHVAQRDAYLADPVTRPMGAELDLAVSCKDGSRVPVDIKLSPIERDGRLEVMAAIRDVTEQVALEKKYRTILETAPDAGFVADAATGEITEVNRQATELLGYTEEELVGMRQVELHPSGEADRYRQLFEEHVDRGRAVFSRFPDGSDILVETDEGDRIPVEINAQVFELADRRLVTGVFRDVSDQREYERRLEREIDRLENLASILSHDVRSPLGVAEGYTELVQESGDVSKLDRVARAQERVRGIIESVLEMIEKGQSIGEASLEPIDLEERATQSWRMTNTNGSTLVVEESVSFLA